jgi:hypothetical protein
MPVTLNVSYLTVSRSGDEVTVQGSNIRLIRPKDSAPAFGTQLRIVARDSLQGQVIPAIARIRARRLATPIEQPLALSIDAA